MADNMNGFPPPSPPWKQVDWNALCEQVDMSRDVPVVYGFGGAAPTTIPEEAVSIDAISTSGRRLFVEYDPYEWNPQ